LLVRAWQNMMLLASTLSPCLLEVETSLQQAVDSIQHKLRPFKQIERLIKARDGLKVDYESFKRKLDVVNEKIEAGTLQKVCG
jgi:hypothetical protein